ncbi:MAG: hypothetical protein H7Y43_15340, partial [Akkermansiaceae bacterium]|nr:hypothetical protein [Verrucomicrobiales bacterium]
ALLEIRELNTRAIVEGRGYAELFQDLDSINDHLEDQDATYALYKSMVQKDRQLASQCYFYAEALLVRKGDYQLCLDMMGGPKRRFDLIRQVYVSQLESHKHTADSYKRMAEMNEKNGITNRYSVPDYSVRMLDMAREHFVSSTRQLIEILVGANRTNDAETIRQEALGLLNDSRIDTAISDAETKLGKAKPAAPASAGTSTNALQTSAAPLDSKTNSVLPAPLVAVPAAPLTEATRRDLNARFTAANGILAFPEKDASMSALARDAAAAGDVDIVGKALGQMTAFTKRDEATRLAARRLATNGHRAEALELARTITAFTVRDAALRELADK